MLQLYGLRILPVPGGLSKARYLRELIPVLLAFLSGPPISVGIIFTGCRPTGLHPITGNCLHAGFSLEPSARYSESMVREKEHSSLITGMQNKRDPFKI